MPLAAASDSCVRAHQAAFPSSYVQTFLFIWVTGSSVKWSQVRCSAEGCHRCFQPIRAHWASASDAHVGVHLAQSVTHGGEVAAQVLHHVLDAAGVFEQVDALRVRVVVHRERPLDRLSELPVRERTHGHNTSHLWLQVNPLALLFMFNLF